MRLFSLRVNFERDMKSERIKSFVEKSNKKFNAMDKKQKLKNIRG